MLQRSVGVQDADRPHRDAGPQPGQHSGHARTRRGAARRASGARLPGGGGHGRRGGIIGGAGCGISCGVAAAWASVGSWGPIVSIRTRQASTPRNAVGSASGHPSMRRQCNARPCVLYAQMLRAEDWRPPRPRGSGDWALQAAVSVHARRAGAIGILLAVGAVCAWKRIWIC